MKLREKGYAKDSNEVVAKKNARDPEVGQCNTKGKHNERDQGYVHQSITDLRVGDEL